MTRPIDADALREQLQNLAYDDWNQGIIKSFADACNEIIEIVEEQPTIDAEPVRHGKFIGTEFDGYSDGNPVYYEWKCSECGCVFEDDEPTYNYCPNCGARMDE